MAEETKTPEAPLSVGEQLVTVAVSAALAALCGFAVYHTQGFWQTASKVGAVIFIIALSASGLELLKALGRRASGK